MNGNDPVIAILVGNGIAPTQMVDTAQGAKTATQVMKQYVGMALDQIEGTEDAQGALPTNENLTHDLAIELVKAFSEGCDEDAARDVLARYVKAFPEGDNAELVAMVLKKNETRLR